MKTIKEEFIDIFSCNIKREGADRFLDYLQKTDFFTAPASTKYHLAYEGGLAQHSINVYRRLYDLCEVEATKNGKFVMPSLETIAIVGLLHDLCKVNFYKVDYRNKKNEEGSWERVPYYIIDEQLPYGHGEKSTYILAAFMRLTREEAIAIRFHMGFSSCDFRGGDQSVGKAFELFPLAVLTHIADLEATYLDEAKKENKGETT